MAKRGLKNIMNIQKREEEFMDKHRTEINRIVRPLLIIGFIIYCYGTYY